MITKDRIEEVAEEFGIVYEENPFEDEEPEEVIVYE